MQLSSSAFDEGDRIPTRYTADGDDVSVPLTWTSPPEDTVELALVVDDPDAPRPEPWVHWLLYHIPADRSALREGLPRVERLDEPAGAAQGRNSWSSDNLGYRGPAPPPGHGPHRYRFTLHALDEKTDVGPDADVASLQSAIEGHVIASARLTGVYER
ncbi:MAG: YbhB/YbcL family Raf kinase inhibitor-like protein [Gemmatimonadota bacterium]